MSATTMIAVNATSAGAAPKRSEVVLLNTLNAPVTYVSSMDRGGVFMSFSRNEPTGPAFTVSKPTTLTEVGSFVTVACPYWAPCSEPLAEVAIYRLRKGEWIPEASPLAVSPLSRNNVMVDRSAYEAARFDLRLRPGKYVALFRMTSQYTGMVLVADDADQYVAGEVPEFYMIDEDAGWDVTFIGPWNAAYRIVGESRGSSKS